MVQRTQKTRETTSLLLLWIIIRPPPPPSRPEIQHTVWSVLPRAAHCGHMCSTWLALGLHLLQALVKHLNDYQLIRIWR